MTTWHGSWVLDYFAGNCHVAASPLLGATGDRGEFLTLLADRLVDDGLCDTVIIVSSGIGGSPVSRWQRGGDLSLMLMTTVRWAMASSLGHWSGSGAQLQFTKYSLFGWHNGGHTSRRPERIGLLSLLRG